MPQASNRLLYLVDHRFWFIFVLESKKLSVEIEFAGLKIRLRPQIKSRPHIRSRTPIRSRTEIRPRPQIRSIPQIRPRP